MLEARLIGMECSGRPGWF